MAREYAKVAPQFWTGRTGRLLRDAGRDVQLLSLYLITCPSANMIGLYYLPLATIAHELGWTKEGASKGLRRASEGDFCAYDEEAEQVWVYNAIVFQVGEHLKPNDHRIAGIMNTLREYRSSRFCWPFYHMNRHRYPLPEAPWIAREPSPLEGPSKPLRSQEQEQEQEQEEKKSIVGLASDATPQSELRSQARTVLEFLNAKTGRTFRPTETTLRLIVARLRTGATVEDCRGVIARKVREWAGDPKMAAYLRPETLFNATKFESYLGQREVVGS